MIHDPEMAVGAARQLGAMIDRAQDERFRLLRLVKDYQAKLDAIPEPVSGDHIHRLMESVRKLNDAISQRMGTLHELDATVDKRLDQLARLEASMSILAERVSQQVKEANDFKALVDSAKRQIRATAAAAQAEMEPHDGKPHQPRTFTSNDDPHRPLRALASRLTTRTG